MYASIIEQSVFFRLYEAWTSIFAVAARNHREIPARCAEIGKFRGWMHKLMYVCVCVGIIAGLWPRVIHKIILSQYMCFFCMWGCVFFFWLHCTPRPDDASTMISWGSRFCSSYLLVRARYALCVVYWLCVYFKRVVSQKQFTQLLYDERGVSMREKSITITL